MSKMADAYTACMDLNINPEGPDALRRLWDAQTPDERRVTFPYAGDHGGPTLTAGEFVDVVSAELKALDEGSPNRFVPNAVAFIGNVREALAMVSAGE